MSCRSLVVTGAFGFIGAAVLRAAVESGWRVTALDRATGECPGAEAICIDLTDARALRETLAEIRPDAIIHCAGLGARAGTAVEPNAGATSEQPDATLLYEANARLAWQLLNAAPRESAVIAVSSAAVYGSSAPVPVTEDAPLSGTSHYAASKICCEAVCRAFAAEGRRVAIARPFNVHGPGEPRGSFTAEVIAQVAEAPSGSPVTVRVLETDSVRDFVDVDDVAPALLLMASESGISGPYNVGTGRATSLREYLGIVSNAADVEMRVERTRDDLGGTVSVGDSERLRSLGWEPRHSVEDTVSRQLRAARLSTEGRS